MVQQLTLKTILLCLAVSFAIAVFSITTLGKSLEQKFGLPLLYKLRGPIDPPEKVFILTPYKKAKIGRKTLLRDWERSQHAEIINYLTELNVNQIALDLFFRQYQDQQNDLSLAKSLEQNSKVILNQFVSATESGIGSHVLVRNPIKVFSESATSLAPSLLVDNTHRKDAFYPYYSIINSEENKDCYAYPVDADLPGGVLADYGQNLNYPRVSTLPVAMLEQHLLNSNALSKLLQNTDQTNSSRLCELFQQLRQNLLNKPELLQEQLNANSSPALKSWLETLIYLKDNISRLNNNPGMFLNFYGQPQTIPTFTYDTFKAYYENKPIENKFNNAVVLIGGSFEISDEEKQDNFETAITKGNNKMSGVEIAATAFANLLNNQYLRKFSDTAIFITTLFCSALVFALGIIRKERLLAALLIAMFLAYVYVAVHWFSTKYYWSPIIMPLISFLLSALLLYTARFKTTQKQKEALKSYVPSAAISSVESSRDKAVVRQTTQGVCMVTDVQDFTQISENVAAQEMADLVDEYFSMLNECVTENNGEVYMIDGDSLTAVWLGPEKLVCINSARAALKIIKGVNRFNQKYPDTLFRTRIGMEFGEFVLGNIGNKSHYTFAVVGSTVYTAARLEQYNKQSKTNILVTNNIEKHLNDFDLRDLGEVQFKGKNTPTHVYELIVQK